MSGWGANYSALGPCGKMGPLPIPPFEDDMAAEDEQVRQDMLLAVRCPRRAVF